MSSDRPALLAVQAAFVSSTRMVPCAGAAAPSERDDRMLVGVPQQPLSGPASAGSRVVGASSTAFAGSRGIVQVDQAAGVSNVSVNLVSLRGSNLSSLAHP